MQHKMEARELRCELLSATEAALGFTRTRPGLHCVKGEQLMSCLTEQTRAATGSWRAPRLLTIGTGGMNNANTILPSDCDTTTEIGITIVASGVRKSWTHMV